MSKAQYIVLTSQDIINAVGWAVGTKEGWLEGTQFTVRFKVKKKQVVSATVCWEAENGQDKATARE